MTIEKMVKNDYSFPLREEDILEIKRGKNASPAHKNWYPRYGDESNAIDLYCPANSPVIAAHDGEVKWTKSNSNKGGEDEKYLDDANGISIKHKNNEVSQYLHLDHKKVFVKVGDHVKRGQIIGEVGRTGFVPKQDYHLHFAVLKFTKNKPDTRKDYITLNVTFKKP